MNSNTLNRTLGILGGGQLGKMLLQKAADFNITAHVIDPDSNAPSKDLCAKFINASFKDYDAVMQFGKHCDIITVEIEHVNTEALSELEKWGKKVYPQPAILKMVQDKGLQKLFYQEHNIPTAPFYLVESKSEIKTDKFPLIQKTRTAGYDGKGVKKLNNVADVQIAFDEACVIETYIPFQKEIAVIVARNESGEVSCFPAVEMQFNSEANLVELLFSPADIKEVIASKAHLIATKLINQLQLVGILAVEFFVTTDGDVLVNEIAPRPHNSGHHTIEGNVTSQYEQHLRAIFNLPLGETAIVNPAAMINVLGEKNYTGEAKYEGLHELLKIDGAYLHLYGKKITKPFRKMGHVTVVNKSVDAAITNAKLALQTIKVVS
ncbi:MAG: 5-(carboxyamino)imidazole ribonucleotide synthase [Bacteroidia bacterium]|nr:5-(carboxyamino)imidazole ribonucleotide synthase [Bacteroidia bacterium]HQV00942.1 5-(carboxyamino)imidazole ribonucleotide synthase [Bacteroidia bacterium]